jgi:hypothetical protein
MSCSPRSCFFEGITEAQNNHIQLRNETALSMGRPWLLESRCKESNHPIAKSTKFSRNPTRLKAARCMRRCTVFRSHRTKMFHVKLPYKRRYGGRRPGCLFSSMMLAVFHSSSSGHASRGFSLRSPPVLGPSTRRTTMPRRLLTSCSVSCMR